MDERELARWYAIVRMSFGLAMFLLPATVLRWLLGIEDARRPSVRWMGRIAGGRDLLLGAGALTAYRESSQVGRWCRYAMVADAIDVVSTLTVYRRLKPRRRFVVLGAAVSGAAVGGYLSAQIGD